MEHTLKRKSKYLSLLQDVLGVIAAHIACPHARRAFAFTCTATLRAPGIRKQATALVVNVEPTGWFEPYPALDRLVLSFPRCVSILSTVQSFVPCLVDDITMKAS